MRRTWLLLAVVAAFVALGFTSHSAFAQGAVTGVVIDQDGNPVAGAHVVIQTAERVRGVRPFVGRFETGENGVFGWRQVPVGTYNLRAGARNLGMAAMRVEVNDGQLVEVEIQLQGRNRERPELEYGSIVGQVVDGDGAPIAGAIVTVAAVLEGENGRNVRRVSVRQITNERGAFEFARVPAGNAVVRAGARGYDRAQEDVVVIADQPTEVRITLNAIDPGNGGGRGGGGNGRGGRG